MVDKILTVEEMFLYSITFCHFGWVFMGFGSKTGILFWILLLY